MVRAGCQRSSLTKKKCKDIQVNSITSGTEMSTVWVRARKGKRGRQKEKEGGRLRILEEL